MRRMQAAGVDAFGGQVHTLELAAPASPAPDEVVISVHAAGVANWDEFVRIGDWDVGREPPLALGVEAAGVVAAVGEDVRSLAPGDQVLTHPVPLRHQGAWAQWLLAPAALVARKPAVVGWEAAAAFPVPALTADQALTAGRPGPGRPVGAGARRRRRHRRPGRAAGGRARSDRGRHGGPLECGAGPRLRRARRARLSRSGVAGPRAGRNSGWSGVGAAVNAAPGGAATALQAVASRWPPGHDHRRSAAARTRGRGHRRLCPRRRGTACRAGRALAQGLLSLHVAATRPLAEAATALQDAVAGRVAGASVLMLE